jgi:ATP-dependent Clp protease ATP-binding subunit ClpC
MRYINDRFLPDKAIDLIDEASSKVRLRAYMEPNKIKEIEDELQKVTNEKDEAINIQNFERAAKFRDVENKLKEKLDEEKDKWDSSKVKSMTTLTAEDIAEIIATSTGINVNKLTKTDFDKLKTLEDELHKRVVGQVEAISALTRCIKRNRIGLKDEKRPIGSFLFLGPTGVGKTETAKALAENLFGDENSIIRVDMSEYMDSYSTSKMIGSPPGYVGYDEAGGLTEKIRRKPYSVILFDEIEKAHPDVMNLLLQILEDGRLTDSHGRMVSFKETIIIMTSNVGAKLITDKKSLGFASEDSLTQEKEYETTKKDVMQELKKNFRPEFLNRIDELIVFKKLGEEEIEKILVLLLVNVKERIAKQGINIAFSEDAKKYIISKGVNVSYGARPLRRAVQTYVEDEIANAILDGKAKKGDSIEIIVKNDIISVKKQAKK